MVKKNTFFVLILLLTCLKANAQKMETQQNLYWLRYLNRFQLSQTLNIQTEIENRVFFEHNTQHHLIMHSRLHYSLNKNWEIASGFTYSLQKPHDPNATTSLTVPEYRPNQEINYTTNLTPKLIIANRLRIDERFIKKNNGTVLLDGYDFNLRFRYRLQFTYLLHKTVENKTTNFKLSNEIMFNAGKQIIYNQFDQNRIYVGLEQSLSNSLSVELGYLNWYQQRPAQNQFFDRNIIRLTLLHKI